MIRRKTIFVIGAGASKELDFPLGEELLVEVGKSLSVVATRNGARPADEELWQTIMRLTNGDSGLIGEYANACKRVSDASILGRSIDNIIHQHNDDILFVKCAKIAIANSIIKHENRSVLATRKNQNTPNLDAVKNTWLGTFIQAVCTDHDKTTIRSIFNNVILICFNYDRSIARLLPLGLSSQFSLTIHEAESICQSLQIYHPYGSLGPLPWQTSKGAVEYGRPDVVNLVEVANNIRTFTEQLEATAELAKMHDHLKSATNLVFLGFGYISQNMDILLNDREGFKCESVIGTGYRLSSSDLPIIPSELSFFIERSVRHMGQLIRILPTQCKDFMHEEFRALTR